jgi:hypothetical protein
VRRGLSLGVRRDGDDMVRCEGYTVGSPGCGLAGAQTFRVAVAPMSVRGEVFCMLYTVRSKGGGGGCIEL